MHRFTTDPTWSAPDTSGPVGLLIGSIGGGVVAVTLLVALVLLLRKRRGAALTSVFTALIAIVVTVMVAAVGIMTTHVTSDHEHNMSVASWLDTAYGATVDSTRFEISGDTVQETTASIDGRTVIIKLARTADGHIAAFDSAAKPLPHRG